MAHPKNLLFHHIPQGVGEWAVYKTVKGLRFCADLFFTERHGHRAVVIETIAAIPGMVGGALQHFRCLRKIREDQGWIQPLLDEAANERMHLVVFACIARPNGLERFLIWILQFVFKFFYTFLYMCSSRLAHRFVGYLEEEAIRSYTHYLEAIERGDIPNEKCPEIGIAYWGLKRDARLSDLVWAVRQDESHHRDVNHGFADLLGEK